MSRVVLVGLFLKEERGKESMSGLRGGRGEKRYMRFPEREKRGRSRWCFIACHSLIGKEANAHNDAPLARLVRSFIFHLDEFDKDSQPMSIHLFNSWSHNPKQGWKKRI